MDYSSYYDNLKYLKKTLSSYPSSMMQITHEIFSTTDVMHSSWIRSNCKQMGLYNPVKQDLNKLTFTAFVTKQFSSSFIWADPYYNFYLEIPFCAFSYIFSFLQSSLPLIIRPFLPDIVVFLLLIRLVSFNLG